jgi:AcrR family transcriptional regulator
MANEQRTDRRVAYTKLALRDALIKLMQTQHISGITVKSICELANVNRSTFYLHYRDQYDLLHQIEQEMLESLRERLIEDSTLQGLHGNDDNGSVPGDSSKSNKRPITLTALTKILEYARENADLARVLLSENCDFAFQQDIMELTPLVAFLPEDNLSPRIKDYIIAYGINGCIALAEKWLKEGMIEQPAEFAQIMLQVLNCGTSSFVSGNNSTEAK